VQKDALEGEVTLLDFFFVLFFRGIAYPQASAVSFHFPQDEVSNHFFRLVRLSD